MATPLPSADNDRATNSQAGSKSNPSGVRRDRDFVPEDVNDLGHKPVQPATRISRLAFACEDDACLKRSDEQCCRRETGKSRHTAHKPSGSEEDVRIEGRPSEGSTAKLRQVIARRREGPKKVRRRQYESHTRAARGNRVHGAHVLDATRDRDRASTRRHGAPTRRVPPPCSA